MFVCGGLVYLTITATASGDAASANKYGAGAASMIFIFTAVFVRTSSAHTRQPVLSRYVQGATWLTVRAESQHVRHSSLTGVLP